MAQLIPNVHIANDDDDEDNLTVDDYVMMTTLAEGLMSNDELMRFFALDTLCAAENESEHKKYACFSLNLFAASEFKKFFQLKRKTLRLSASVWPFLNICTASLESPGLALKSCAYFCANLLIQIACGLGTIVWAFQDRDE